MKTIIATLCTLALSLLGMFGANQNSANVNQDTTTNLDTTTVKEYTTDVDSTQDILADTSSGTILNTPQDAQKVEESKAEIRANALGDTAEQEAQTPAVKEDQQSTADQDNQTAAVSQEPTAAPTIAPTAAPTAAPAPTKAPAVVTVSNQQNTVPTVKTVSNTANQNTLIQVSKNCPTNQNAVVYKNVDLSNCKSSADIINKLKQSGYTINSKDLNNIISKVQKNGTTTNNNTSSKPSTGSNSSTGNTDKNSGSTSSGSNSGSTSNTNTSSYANQVLQLVNQERAKAGLSSFTTNSALTAAANKRAQEIVQNFSHTRPNGTSSFTVLGEYNVSYKAAGENIAYGQKTPQEVVTGWMNSPGHRANILNKNFNKIGIGVYQKNGVYYWTQEFTN